ncbi:aldo/keto reductase [Leucobacter soli]|uniref:1-deoxyxylulose-5-phosphate synthase YajO n=1 Tax=Leucobacter soli TaxID=2812850 RepID=A0A916JXU5_9MICO|nr:aldo/keto reductase [Leucobacter soli]CAG7609482.1 1-deoxyxylulose-5-phosphate synthase YajO [Leucobacter soli]
MTRTLGTSDLIVSAAGLGCNNFGRPGSATEDQAGTDAVIGAAIDAGITLFDTADLYGYAFGRSETMMGSALGARRDDIVLATKFGYPESGAPYAGARGSRAYIRASIEGSLNRLRTDRIDLYQMHMPDPETPIAETLAALDELVEEGKVRYIGHSNFSAAQMEEAARTAAELGLARFVSAQNELSLVKRETDREETPAARRLGLGLLPFFPLANGLLTGKFSRDGFPADSRIMRQRPEVAEQADWDALDAYRALCDEWGVTMLEATFGWLLTHEPIASVIAGATTPDQVRQNAAAAEAFRPDAAQRAAIERLFPVPGAQTEAAVE